jgi:hypothetical protein
MAPLTRPVAHFRHYADVAHGHLLHLAQESGFEGEIVIAVPASFSREQLAVLTGVLKHSPFKPVAMMDAAFVSASHQLASGSELIFVDVQLHQLSLTRLHSDGSAMRRDAVRVVPGAGWAGISNILVQTATDAFVSQSRFNPQHSAAWEQQLYNQLPQWLTQFQHGDQELIARVQTDKNNVQARISLSGTGQSGVTSRRPRTVLLDALQTRSFVTMPSSVASTPPTRSRSYWRRRLRSSCWRTMESRIRGPLSASSRRKSLIRMK